jgi:hypothetical protein
LIGEIVKEVVGIGSIAVGLLGPGADVAVGIVGVVELGKRDAAGLLSG